MSSGRPVALLLDYDGTLVPFAPTPDEAVPDRELLDLLAALAASPQVELHLVSGRGLDTMNRWFRHLPAGLWAEHGAACRRGHGAGWELLTPPGFDAGAIDLAEAMLIDAAAAMLAEVTRATPGALVERKHTGVAWHYRMVEPRLADERLVEVRERAAALADDAGLDDRRGAQGPRDPAARRVESERGGRIARTSARRRRRWSRSATTGPTRTCSWRSGSRPSPSASATTRRARATGSPRRGPSGTSFRRSFGIQN